MLILCRCFIWFCVYSHTDWVSHLTFDFVPVSDDLSLLSITQKMDVWRLIIWLTRTLASAHCCQHPSWPFYYSVLGKWETKETKSRLVHPAYCREVKLGTRSRLSKQRKVFGVCSYGRVCCQEYRIWGAWVCRPMCVETTEQLVIMYRAHFWGRQKGDKTRLYKKPLECWVYDAQWNILKNSDTYLGYASGWLGMVLQN